MAPCGLGVVSSQPPCLEGFLPGGGRGHRALKNAEPHAQAAREAPRTPNIYRARGSRHSANLSVCRSLGAKSGES